MRILYIVLFCLAVESSDGVKVDDGKAERNKMLRFVNEATAIIVRYVRDTARSVVMFGDNDEMQNLMLSSLQSSAQPAYVVGPNTSWIYDTAWENLVFIILSDSGDVNVFTGRVEKVLCLSLWDPRSHVIFVDTNISENHTDITFQLLKTIWVEREVLKSLVISVNAKGDKSGKIVVAKRFNPFHRSGKTIDVTSPNNLYDKSSFDGMGYPVKCVVPDRPPFSYEVTKLNGDKTLGGLTGEVLDIISKSLNLSTTSTPNPNFLKDAASWVLPNNFYERFDIVTPLTVLHKDNFKTASYPYATERVVFIVPKAEEIPEWMHAMFPFHYPLWISYMCVFLVLVIFGKMYIRLSGKQAQKTLLSLEMFRLFFVGMFYYQANSSGLRIFLVSVMMFNIVLNNAYSGSFTSLVAVPKYYPDINTIEDLNNYNLYVGLQGSFGPISLSDLPSLFEIADSTDDVTSFLLNRLQMFDSLDDELHTAKVHRNICVLLGLKAAKYEVSRPENILNNRPLLHIAEQNIANLWIVAIFRENFPLLDKVERPLWYVREAGVINEIVRIDVERNLMSHQETGENHLGIDLYQLQTFFFILLFGYVASMLGFSIEILFFSKMSSSKY
ncbi:hypothetical protein PR048_004335 [Dryococelus australis]|uniref:Uncharacterized protein n=1 Tax=Dryococelus australis TaxID=614101 RepID=A0ABQ9I555_9NEOP|nr:hypothetical protein PR048_004335 [Dryococelus australis]